MSAVPLTTIFTPDDACATSWYIASTYDLESFFYVITSLNEGYPDDGCHPYKQASDFWSPGICPSQMNSHEVRIVIEGRSSYWAVTCCNSHFTLQYRDSSTLCASETREQARLRVVLSSDSGSNWATSGTIPAEQVQIIDTHLIALHDPLVVRWDTTDLSLFPSAVSTSCLGVMNMLNPTIETSVPAQSPSLPTSLPTLSLSDHSGDQPHSLPSAAIVGIAVGVVAIFTATLSSIYFVFHHQRRRRRRNARGEPYSPGDELGELDATYTQTFKRWFGKTWRAELGPGEGGARTELDDIHMVGKNGPVFELDSTLVPESTNKPDTVGHSRTARDDAEPRTQEKEVLTQGFVSQDQDEAGLTSPVSPKLSVATPTLVSPLGPDR